MAGFNLNYEEVQDFDLIPPGEYEVIIKSATERTTQKGSTGLSFTLVIRNDVEQKYKNRLLFLSLWKRKEPTQADMQVQGYSFKQIMSLAKAAALPSGKSYETVNDLCADLVGHVLRVTAAHSVWEGQTREEVKYTNASKFPDCKHVFKDSSGGNGGSGAQDQFASNITVGGQEFEEILGADDVPF